MNKRETYQSHSLSVIAAAAPKPTLSFTDAVALIVGIVIGAGIFETPTLVAANASSKAEVVLLWLLGGGMSLLGALCYAELATTYPHVGGNYHYLMRAFGRRAAFLFAWARMTVIQTGSIALLAFVLGDYASQLFRLGPFSASLYAAIAIACLTGLNILGVQQGKCAQNWLTVAQVLGLLLVVVAGMAFIPLAPSVPSTTSSQGTLGLALLFVLLSYGGWNEAAYISAEVQDGRRNIARSLLWSVGIITAVYLLVNLAYLQGLGLAAMAESEAIAADLMRRVLGPPGAAFISLLITICTLSSINATIFTGARTNYALGQDFSLFSFLGRWQPNSNTPAAALLAQGAIALTLVLLGTVTRRGFETMVDYTAPIFWFFFLLTGVALLVLRKQEPERPRPFQVPLYPWIPLLFCLISLYLLYSSLVYTGIGAFLGVAVVLAGIPLFSWSRRR
uniref:APC family permease n=1 Tax=Trichocoleus desertorum TaxID=1481672 RepID=UPI0025B3C887|nr:amino acid permease [Trichocoleus desertorum]